MSDDLFQQIDKFKTGRKSIGDEECSRWPIKMITEILKENMNKSRFDDYQVMVKEIT